MGDPRGGVHAPLPSARRGKARVARLVVQAGGKADGPDDDATIVHAATEAQRRRLVALRAAGTIGDAAFQRVEEEVGRARLDAAPPFEPIPAKT